MKINNTHQSLSIAEEKQSRERMGIMSLAKLSLMITLFLFALSLVDAQTPIPPKYDGFLYKSVSGADLGFTNTILIEAFLDPVCPDSRDSWPPLKQALDYSGRVSLIVHPFPLP